MSACPRLFLCLLALSLLIDFGEGFSCSCSCSSCCDRGKTKSTPSLTRLRLEFDKKIGYNFIRSPLVLIYIVQLHSTTTFARCRSIFFDIHNMYNSTYAQSQLLMLLYCIRNAAKRSRQHAGKKYREYAQRHVCFINEQVP